MQKITLLDPAEVVIAAVLGRPKRRSLFHHDINPQAIAFSQR
jgi:hypothetical protein